MALTEKGIVSVERYMMLGIVTAVGVVVALWVVSGKLADSAREESARIAHAASAREDSINSVSADSILAAHPIGQIPEPDIYLAVKYGAGSHHTEEYSAAKDMLARLLVARQAAARAEELRAAVQRNRMAGFRCNGADAKAQRVARTNPDWPNGTIADISCGYYREGMTRDQVRATMGRPDDINTTHSSVSGDHEQWVYGSSYLYFDNDRLTSWQHFR